MLNKVIIALIVVVLTVGLTFAGKGDCCPSQTGGQTDEQIEKETHALCSDSGQDPCIPCASEKVDPCHINKMEGATINAIYAAEALYTCPMHSEVVTDKADLKCPLCKMKLTKMSAEQVEKLKGSNPKGCVMCPIVVAGDSGIDNCATCKMKLTEIKLEEHQEHKHSY